MTAQDDDYYDILKVAEDAPPEVIKAARNALAKQHHEDAGGSSDLMRRINEAYAVLADPESRHEYDLRRAAPPSDPFAGLDDWDTQSGTATSTPPSPPQPPPPPPPPRMRSAAAPDLPPPSTHLTTKLPQPTLGTASHAATASAPFVAVWQRLRRRPIRSLAIGCLAIYLGMGAFSYLLLMLGLGLNRNRGLFAVLLIGVAAVLLVRTARRKR